LDISPSSVNKSMPIRLVVVAAEEEDPRCVLLAPASFWKLVGKPCRWRTVALVFVSIVCHGRGDRSDPLVSFLVFSYSLHYLGHCLNMRYTRNILAFKI